MNAFILFLSRLCISAIFIFAGVGKFMDYEGTASFMEAHDMTLIPLFLYGAAVIELLAGLALVFGYKTKCAALVLALFLIPVTYIFHGFWNFSGVEQQAEMIKFFGNLAIFGGLLSVYANGPGCCSVDGSCSC